MEKSASTNITEKLTQPEKNFDLYGWNYAARPERAEALSPGQRPGYNANLQGAL